MDLTVQEFPRFASRKSGAEKAVSKVIKACPSSAAPRHLESPLPLAGGFVSKHR